MRIFSILILGALVLPFHSFAASNLNIIHKQLVRSSKLSLSDQAYCVQNPDGSTDSYRSTVRVIPASVSKIYTFDFALNKLGKDFRYQTDFYINDDTLYINGGGDPHFVTENLEKVFEALPSSSITKVVFSPNFYFNWKKPAGSVRGLLTSSLKQILGRTATVSYSEAPYSGSGEHFLFESAPLYMLMKQINDYSTNISADVLMERAGGYTEFANYMKNTYGATSRTVKFGTGSGLRGNYTTCDLTLKVLKHFETSLNNAGLHIEDIMSMPRQDPGIVKDRLSRLKKTNNVVLKSGFVNYHQNLAGVINTPEGSVYFAVFGGYTSMSLNDRAKKFVDMFVENIVSSYTAKAYDYVPNDTLFDSVRVTKIN